MYEGHMKLTADQVGLPSKLVVATKGIPDLFFFLNRVVWPVK